MLRISKKADYAVFLLGAIARQGVFPGGAAESTVVSAQEIARLCGLNKSVVANLLKDFARQGLLDSVRGLRGGYRLARSPGEISLQEILEVVEGKFVLVDCINDVAPGANGSSRAPAAPSGEAESNGHECSLIGICPSKNPMRLVHQRIGDLFAGISLDELCCLPANAHDPATLENTR
ncbi:MAG: Rrf2 family transcriptional regulator [Planctomycetes bacterium]|nr:Rrf2 family transcriptional regulator [Planctomycetota bacterium]